VLFSGVEPLVRALDLVQLPAPFIRGRHVPVARLAVEIENPERGERYPVGFNGAQDGGELLFDSLARRPRNAKLTDKQRLLQRARDRHRLRQPANIIRQIVATY